MFLAPRIVIDSCQKRFVINMHLRQCFAQAMIFRLIKRKNKFLASIFYFQKKPSASKNPELKNLASKCEIGNPA